MRPSKPRSRSVVAVATPAGPPPTITTTRSPLTCRSAAHAWKRWRALKSAACTYTLPLATCVGKVLRPPSVGASSMSPVRTLKHAPCHGHRTRSIHTRVRIRVGLADGHLAVFVGYLQPTRPWRAERRSASSWRSWRRRHRPRATAAPWRRPRLRSPSFYRAVSKNTLHPRSRIRE